MKGHRILIFAKAPLPGRVKTRLIPALGKRAATDLARRMLEETVRQASRVAVARTEICASPAPAHEDWRDLMPAGAALVSDQGDGDLGARLARAARRVLDEGDRVLLIGTDCPALDSRRLKAACWELEAHDAVIHPAFDGGYALLGLAGFDASLFQGIAWSSDSVARETIARVRRLGWSLHIGETLRDVDEPEDLAALATDSRFRGIAALARPEP